MEKQPDIAPEQYELYQRPLCTFSMNRREFFKILGSGIAIMFTVTNGMSGSLAQRVPLEDQIAAWIHINENGLVTVYTGKAEVGQNIRTSLAQAVAEELEVPMDKIEMILGDTALTPYDRGTFGSRSTPYMAPQLRKAAASARELLIDLASEEMKVDRKILVAENGFIKNKQSGRSINIGLLTKGKQLVQPVNENISLKNVKAWKVLGTSVPKINGETFVTGKHKYVSDLKLPDMLMGKVLRAPSYGATLISADTSLARAVPGVTVVHDGAFIGVAAPDTKTAVKALAAIKAEWKKTTHPSRKEIFTHLKEKAENGRGEDEAGNVQEGFDTAMVKIDQTFYVDYIAHVPLEPRAGVAEWVGNKLTVWTGTQRPFGVQEDLSEVLGVPKEKIRVIQPDTGSGYGGKHTGEAGVEAARLSKAAGKPVKVVWTREEEFTWAYFRPAGVIEVKAGADRNGTVTSWEFHNYNSGSSGIETPYEIANRKIQFHPSDSPLRQGSYRGLAATANTFARECIMNDLAGAVNADPLDFRLRNLRNERMQNVLTAAAKAFGWNEQKPKAGTGHGIACGFEKGSYVATCATVSVSEGGETKVKRVVVSFECGGIVNPVHLENQILGAVVQGLGGALFERVDFSDGKILNPLLSKYRVPRFADTPVVEVVMLDRKDIPSVGAGETPILGIAPAVRNAIVAAIGKRLYTLPLAPDGVKA